MKIHLVRSEEISTSRFGTIAGIIRQFRGPMEFCIMDEDISVEDHEEQDGDDVSDHRDHKPETLTWNALFGKCREFRENNLIKDDEYVVLFTDHRNERNWFSSWDPSGKLNFFVQTSEWELYIEGEPNYPVIYELVTIPLFALSGNNLDEIMEIAHDDPRGCPFDMCGNKTHVRLRLRTGDICPECRERLIRGNLDPLIARQIFMMLDHIRSQILNRERLMLIGPSRMRIIKSNLTLQFPDLGNISVRLSPKEITVYLFFFLHQEGVHMSRMSEYREDIRAIYRNFSSDAQLEGFNFTVDLLSCMNGDTDRLSEAITNTNKKIRQTVYPEIAGYYIISGEKGKRKKISINRGLVDITGDIIVLNRRH